MAPTEDASGPGDGADIATLGRAIVRDPVDRAATTTTATIMDPTSTGDRRAASIVAIGAQARGLCGQEPVAGAVSGPTLVADASQDLAEAADGVAELLRLGD